MIYAAQPLRRPLSEQVAFPVTQSLRNGWDSDAQKYWLAVNRLRASLLPTLALYHIDGMVRSIKGQPNSWAVKNGITLPSTNLYQHLKFCALCSNNASNDSGNRIPLVGREWQQPELLFRANTALGTTTSSPFDTVTDISADGLNFDLVKNQTSDFCTIGIPVGSVTSGEKARVEFNYTNVSGNADDFRLYFQENVNGGTELSNDTTRTFLSGHNAIEIELTGTESTAFIHIQQNVGTTGSHQFRNFRVWLNWENNWTKATVTAPVDDAINGGHLQLQNGAVFDAELNGSNHFFRTNLDYGTFAQSDDVCFGIVCTTDPIFSGHRGLMAIGNSSGNYTASGADIRHLGTSNDKFQLQRNDGSGVNTFANIARAVADDVVTDVSARIRSSSDLIRHEGSNVSDSAPEDNTISLNTLAVGSETYGGSQYFRMHPYFIWAMTGHTLANADNDRLQAIAKTGMIALKAL
jgi:hypothetical protein